MTKTAIYLLLDLRYYRPLQTEVSFLANRSRAHLGLYIIPSIIGYWRLEKSNWVAALQFWTGYFLIIWIATLCLLPDESKSVSCPVKQALLQASPTSIVRSFQKLWSHDSQLVSFDCCTRLIWTWEGPLINLNLGYVAIGHKEISWTNLNVN